MGNINQDRIKEIPFSAKLYFVVLNLFVRAIPFLFLRKKQCNVHCLNYVLVSSWILSFVSLIFQVSHNVMLDRYRPGRTKATYKIAFRNNLPWQMVRDVVPLLLSITRNEFCISPRVGKHILW